MVQKNKEFFGFLYIFYEQMSASQRTKSKKRNNIVLKEVRCCFNWWVDLQEKEHDLKAG